MSTHTASTQGPEVSPDALLTIGELAAHTGLTPEVLRTWESRHGFPEPTRLPSGHRRYTGADVLAVRRVLEERERGVRLEQAVEAARSAGHVEETGSVFASLTARHPGLTSYTLSKRTLLALSWAIEDESAAQANRAVLVGTFQRGRYFGQSAKRWAEMGRTARAAVVMADFPEHVDDEVPARVALPPESPLLREWIVVCDSPGLTAALVAWELPGQGDLPEGDRLFESVWTVDARVVRDAAVVAAEAAAAVGSASGVALGRLLEDAPPPVSSSPRAATAVFNRMVAYTDGTVLRGRTRP
jgi:DICT domain-containing protein